MSKLSRSFWISTTHFHPTGIICASKHPICSLSGISGASSVFKELYPPWTCAKTNTPGSSWMGFLPHLAGDNPGTMTPGDLPSPRFTDGWKTHRITSQVPLCPCCLLCVLLSSPWPWTLGTSPGLAGGHHLVFLGIHLSTRAETRGSLSICLWWVSLQHWNSDLVLSAPQSILPQ